ncbi:MAG: hypothetical protein ACXVHR_10555 [Methanobacterium sp.]
MDIEMYADCPHKSPVVTASVGATSSLCYNCWFRNVCPFSQS